MRNRNKLHSKIRVMLALIVAVLTAAVSGCRSISGTGANPDLGSPVSGQVESAHASEGSGEHGGAEESDEAGREESGNTLTLDQTHDTVRKGARLILNYDAATNTLVGTVDNTTNATLTRVRIEVHLSNGVELGPTTPVDLAPGQIVDVILPATGQSFDGWTPHAEVGPSTSGETGEHAEDNSEGGSEHGGGESDEHGSGGESGG